jgi:hypothetical protein
MSITTELIETGAKRDGRGRRIATREEKVALIAQYRGSGLTQRAFAEREGIKFRRRSEGVMYEGRVAQII